MEKATLRGRNFEVYFLSVWAEEALSCHFVLDSCYGWSDDIGSWRLSADSMERLEYLIGENVLRGRPTTFIDTNPERLLSRLVWRMAPTTEGTVLMAIDALDDQGTPCYYLAGEVHLDVLKDWLAGE